MSGLPPKVLIDTNVPKTANLALAPGQDPEGTGRLRFCMR